MATELAADKPNLRTRAVGAALVVLAVLAGFSTWQAVHAGPQVLRGTVALVNAEGSKFCVSPDAGGEQWCGALATSADKPVTVGQKVTVLVNAVDTEPEGGLTIGTVVPAGFAVK